MSKNYLSVIAENTGASSEEVEDVLTGMIISAKNQHGAKASPSELLVVGAICAKYQLNPLVKEASAFVSGGKLQVVIQIDGWYKIVNRQPDYDGCEFEERFDEKGKIFSVTCKIYNKNRAHPSCATEYFSECVQNKDTWLKWPIRMLRHKAFIQAARMAFGISEAVDPDEADRYQGEKVINPSSQSGSDKIDRAAIQSKMAACQTENELRAICTSIREELQGLGVWERERGVIVQMNQLHKDRIASQAEHVIEGELINDEEIPFE